jgi:FlaA1/EpsC-like NDP-sugar epimerase
VTGAAGSIGSEIVRQIMQFSFKRLVLVDQAETPMFNIGIELDRLRVEGSFEFIVADITSKPRMEKIFSTFKPDIVYHAAAYKHVPMMECNALEAIKNNVTGTKILADLSAAYKVSKFIFISTDKAVNPTNVMGASKRIAEMYVQALNQHCSTSFITTRFGNVLGSNGSVIPLFTKQIEYGGPVTVTHPEVTRYFMTIPEASQLVLEAGAYGRGGEIFIFDMGKSIKILDLAKNMIKLAGLEPFVDIQIEFSGLRPGEKLYEELLHHAEGTIATHHPKIMIAKVREYDLSVIKQRITVLEEAVASQNAILVVREMKNTVPEFISQNSVFEDIDKEIQYVNKVSSLQVV